MIRLVHIFDLKSRDNDESFINWLDANLYGKAKEFGCEERKTWIFLDGVKNPYSRVPRPMKRPRYVLEAFWKSQKGADDFRDWLKSADGESYRKNWNDNVTNHSVVRYIDFGPIQNMGDD